MENKEISIILFGKPKAFEIYELFENGAVKNIETENQSPEFLPISISDNICHFYKRKGFYYYEVYSEAFANNVTRAGNLIGFCIKSKNKIVVNTEFVNVLFSNYQDIKNDSLKNNTFIYSSLWNDFINKIKIEKFVSAVILSINSFATQSKNFNLETRLIERGNNEIGSIQLDLDKYEYYISQDDGIFKDTINKQKFFELGEQVYQLNKSGKVIPKKALIVEPKSDNNVSIDFLNRKIQQSDNVDEIKKLLKQKDKIIWQEQQKTKKRNLVIIIICILFAIGGSAFGWYSKDMNKKIADKESDIVKNERRIEELDKKKEELYDEIANKKRKLQETDANKAELMGKLDELRIEHNNLKADFKDYKDSHKVSQKDLDSYILKTEIDNKKYFDKSYIDKNYVSISKYNELKEKNEKLKEPADTNASKKLQPEDTDKLKNAETPKVHIVKLGETLSSIATNYYTTIEKLKKLNKLKSEDIKPGQKLKLKE
ncbi:MAG: LysM peptidoglycan-binding domain-containing protein [Bacteroidales bacterium]|nr:LysM peptidoglycan-binding domain-containing protein [Bacteroidales bacterium]